jgi:multimeric flavodoxin WrbA
MKQLIGISASARNWGNCETATKSILLAGAEAGAKIEFVRLTDLVLEPCRGCFGCLVGERRCRRDDDLYRLLERTQAADALVLAAPVYFMSPPASLLGLLDRLLAMAHQAEGLAGDRPAVTLTFMGDHRWRGVARPLVNIVAGLLGYSLAESLSLVAEGPGEVLNDGPTVGRFISIGKSLAAGDPVGTDVGERLCPVCRSDFFRIEPPDVVCPVCGTAGDLEAYTSRGRFLMRSTDVRWGIGWLRRHVESWINPSIERHRQGRRSTMRNVIELRKRYEALHERGMPDV